jgi:glycosyltransferase involved in cell wall biosynthesis
MRTDGPSRRRHVSVYAGRGWHRWSPASIEQQGIGGSETALVRVSTLLATRGWHVDVYADVDEEIVNGVTYRRFGDWDPQADVDAFVSFRRPDAFAHPIAAPIRVLWCQDASYGQELTLERARKMTAVVAVSSWHRATLASRYSFVTEKLRIVRNGVSLRDPRTGVKLFLDARRPFAQRSPHCIYSSSPAYGLHILLELWPEIRRRVPEAELHLFYGWDTYDAVALSSHRLRAYKVLLLHLLDRAGNEDGGVLLHGRVGQSMLHAAMERAKVWSYTSVVHETSCIGGMEARAAGLPIVTSERGALPETVGHDHGILIPFDQEPADDGPGGLRSPAYRAAFTDAVVRLLVDETFWTEQHERALDGVPMLDWSERAADWEDVLSDRR